MASLWPADCETRSVLATGRELLSGRRYADAASRRPHSMRLLRPFAGLGVAQSIGSWRISPTSRKSAAWRLPRPSFLARILGRSHLAVFAADVAKADRGMSRCGIPWT